MNGQKDRWVKGRERGGDCERERSKQGRELKKQRRRFSAEGNAQTLFGQV